MEALLDEWSMAVPDDEAPRSVTPSGGDSRPRSANTSHNPRGGKHGDAKNAGAVVGGSQVLHHDSHSPSPTHKQANGSIHVDSLAAADDTLYEA